MRPCWRYAGGTARRRTALTTVLTNAATGEAAHHHAIAAAAQGRLLVAAGHFATEHPVVYALARQLSARFAPVPVLVSEADADPFVYD